MSRASWWLSMKWGPLATGRSGDWSLSSGNAGFFAVGTLAPAGLVFPFQSDIGE